LAGRGFPTLTALPASRALTFGKNNQTFVGFVGGALQDLIIGRSRFFEDNDFATDCGFAEIRSQLCRNQTIERLIRRHW
jgi:hypothetical protein